MDTDTAPRNFLLYDGDCPFCTNYVRMVQLRKAVGPVELLDMRQHPELVAYFRDRGYDLNDGMLLRLDGHIYWGADCVNRLALSSSTCSTRSTPPYSAARACRRRCTPSCGVAAR